MGLQLRRRTRPTASTPCGAQDAGRRELWFRQLQWAETLLADPHPERRSTGRRVLAVLAEQAIAVEDLLLVDALNQPDELADLVRRCRADIDDVVFVQAPPQAGAEERSWSTGS